MSKTERAAAWQRRIEEWQQSGLSGSQFCEQQGVAYHQFVYWRRKALQQAGPEAERSELQGAGFARATALSLERRPDGSGLTVSLPGGISIAGVRADNVAVLAAILRQL